MTNLAVVFPGGYAAGSVPHVAPLATVVRRALEESGAVVERILYDDLQDRGRFLAGVRRDVARALEVHDPRRVTLVAKSLGTAAVVLGCAGPVATCSVRVVWLTPVWRWERHPRLLQVTEDEVWEAALACECPSLHVVGLADELHDAKRHARVPGETLAIAGADHGLELPGNIPGTLGVWRDLAVTCGDVVPVGAGWVVRC